MKLSKSLALLALLLAGIPLRASAAAQFVGEAGDRAGAETHLRALAAINPEDPALARPSPRR